VETRQLGVAGTADPGSADAILGLLPQRYRTAAFAGATCRSCGIKQARLLTYVRIMRRLLRQPLLRLL
jgi:hypothetical protein